MIRENSSFVSHAICILQVSDPSELVQFVRKDPQDGKYFCTLCNVFSHINLTCVRNHVEAKHFPGSFTYNCPFCSLTFNNRTSLNNHKAKKHK